jgi:acyl-CoA-binding protein
MECESPSFRKGAKARAFAILIIKRNEAFLEILEEQKESAMSELLKKFETASQEVTQLPSRPDNETLLKLYSLFKQGKEGDISGGRPGFGDFKGRAKYDAWAELKGISKEKAMLDYIDLVEKLKG